MVAQCGISRTTGIGENLRHLCQGSSEDDLISTVGSELTVPRIKDLGGAVYVSCRRSNLSLSRVLFLPGPTSGFF